MVDPGGSAEGRRNGSDHCSPGRVRVEQLIVVFPDQILHLLHWPKIDSTGHASVVCDSPFTIVVFNHGGEFARFQTSKISLNAIFRQAASQMRLNAFCPRKMFAIDDV